MPVAPGVQAARDAKASITHRADVTRTVEMTRVLMEVGQAANEVVAQVLSDYEVTASVAGVLWCVVPGSQPPTLRDVATRLHCDPSTISLAVDKLEGMGLATRQIHPTDGRKRTVTLTERGQELWDALSTRLHTSGVFADLEAHELNTLQTLLTKIGRLQRA